MGSFVTDKRTPGDYDVCWEQAGVDWAKLDPVFLQTQRLRTGQKATYGGEFFIADAPADPFGTEYLDFFQTDKVTFLPKGIVALNLNEMP
jgi:hypothetical protein